MLRIFCSTCWKYQWILEPMCTKMFQVQQVWRRVRIGDDLIIFMPRFPCSLNNSHAWRATMFFQCFCIFLGLWFILSLWLFSILLWFSILPWSLLCLILTLDSRLWLICPSYVVPWLLLVVLYITMVSNQAVDSFLYHCWFGPEIKIQRPGLWCWALLTPLLPSSIYQPNQSTNQWTNQPTSQWTSVRWTYIQPTIANCYALSPTMQSCNPPSTTPWAQPPLEAAPWPSTRFSPRWRRSTRLAAETAAWRPTRASRGSSNSWRNPAPRGGNATRLSEMKKWTWKVN